jgi:hypothetical protein
MKNTNNIEYDHIPITNNEGELLGIVTVEGEVIESDDIKCFLGND